MQEALIISGKKTICDFFALHRRLIFLISFQLCYSKYWAAQFVHFVDCYLHLIQITNYWIR